MLLRQRKIRSANELLDYHLEHSFARDFSSQQSDALVENARLIEVRRPLFGRQIPPDQEPTVLRPSRGNIETLERNL